MQEVYHCPPTVLAEQPSDLVNLHLWMLGIVNKYTPKSKPPKGGRSQ